MADGVNGNGGDPTATDALESSFQREEVDATVRGEGFTGGADTRGLAVATEAAARLVEEFGAKVLDWKVFRDEVTVVVDAAAIVELGTFARDTLGFRLLSDLSPCDWLDRRAESYAKRFSVAYHLTKLEPGAPRLRLQLWCDEGEDVPSVMGVWPTADWHEREAFDFFGIWFSGRAGLKRIIMPDDWEGHPLRKDYPLGGEPVKFTNSLREI